MNTINVEKTAAAHFITNHFGEFEIRVYRDNDSGEEHVILIKGDIANSETILCRVASECLTGMALDSADCDCLSQHGFSLGLLEKAGCGILILLRQEGRGHGLTIKIKALHNKNNGDDTFAAVEHLGLPPDIRKYDVAAKILESLQVDSIILITSNPEKSTSLSKLGVKIKEIVPTPLFETPQNKRHLLAKIARGHHFSEGTKNA